MRTLQWKTKSPIGDLYLVASEQALLGVYFNPQKVEMTSKLTGSSPEVLILKETQKQLEEYFSGKRKEFDLKLDLQGTDFQKKVWNQLLKIPFGQTISYRQLAERVKNEKACRAVGTANGKNPVCVIVPCHRVIAADGTLGGYSGGLHIKTKLLNLEKAPYKTK